MIAENVTWRIAYFTKFAFPLKDDLAKEITGSKTADAIVGWQLTAWQQLLEVAAWSGRLS